MNFNYRLFLIFAGIGAMLTLIANIPHLKSDVSLQQEKETTDTRWSDDARQSNNSENIDYELLRERNFQLLSRRERERLRGAAVASNEPVKVEPKVDKTLRENFHSLDDEHQVGLVGIFAEDEYYAVFQKIHYQSKTSTFQQVKVNEHIGHYQLVNLSENTVTLKKTTNELLQLHLFNKSKSTHE